MVEIIRKIAHPWLSELERRGLSENQISNIGRNQIKSLLAYALFKTIPTSGTAVEIEVA